MNAGTNAEGPTNPRAPTVRRSSGGGSSLADVIDRVLDKGIVIDAWARISIVGIEILTIEARVIVASVETYLKYAEAIGEVDLASRPASAKAPKAEQLQAEVVSPPAPPAKEPEKKEVALPMPKVPSEDDVAGFLSQHEEGLRLEDVEQHFHAAREQIEPVVKHLLEAQRARKDKRNMLFPKQAQ